MNLTPLNAELQEEIEQIDKAIKRIRRHPKPESDDYYATTRLATVRALGLYALLGSLEGKLVSPDGHLICQRGLKQWTRKTARRVRITWDLMHAAKKPQHHGVS